MGKVVKHITSAITGKSGGGKQETKTTENSNTAQSQSNWLASNPQYKAAVEAAINEGANYQVPQYQLAGMSPETQQALQQLSTGVDTGVYSGARDYMLSQGQQSLTDAMSYKQQLANSQGVLNQYQNQSQEDYDAAIKREWNSDLVNSQKQLLEEDLNDQYQGQVADLNHRATSAGAMGSSRAGVSQGVIAGNAQKALARGINDIEAREEQAATSRYQGYMNGRIGAATTNAGIAQSMYNSAQTFGMNAYTQGMGYANQYNQAVTQNAQNKFTAGQYLQQYQQQQLDVNRQNAMLAQSPALQRLMTMNSGLAPIAGWSATGTGTSSGTTTNSTVVPGSGGNLLGGLMGAGMSAFGSYMGMGSMGSGAMGAFGGAFGNTYGR